MKNTQILTYKQLNVFFKTIESFAHAERNRLTVALTYYGALRIGEVAQLKWKDVIDANLLPLTQIDFRKEQVKARENQSIFVSKKLRMEITRYLKFYMQQNGKVDLNDPLIQTQKRSAFSANSLCQHINKLYKRANLPHITTHSGRKSYITQLSNKAVNIKAIMKLVRHKNLATTQRYIQLTDDELQKANDLID